jgi:hypothetical protein
MRSGRWACQAARAKTKVGVETHRQFHLWAGKVSIKYVGHGDLEVPRQIGAAIKEGMHPIVKQEGMRMVSLLRFSVIK